MRLLRNYMLVLFLSSTAFIARAQNGSEISDAIFSETLNENRALDISLPAEYETGSTERYEVIYILDGKWNTALFSSIYSFAMEEEFVPPVILVSIPNTYIDGQNMRDRDFLPLEMKDNERAGGADEFIDLLKKEVIPYIDNNYSTKSVNSLYGHSYGELFAEDPKLAKKL